MMQIRQLFCVAPICLATVCWATVAPLRADDSGDLVSVVINLLGDKDKDVRSLGLEQVRTEAKGAEATRQFAAQLAKLPSDAQVGLLSALADRGDDAARPAVVDLLSGSHDAAVRVAAIAALGSLGQTDDLPLLVKLLASPSKSEQKAARKSLVNLPGDAAAGVIAAALQAASSPVRVVLLDVLTVRRASGTVPQVLQLAVDRDPAVRGAAMKTLGELAGPENVSDMLGGLLKAEKGPEREAAERAVAQVCRRQKGDDQVKVLEAAVKKLPGDVQIEVLPTLGRVGGQTARAICEESVAESDPKQHAAGLKGLCNWPDASIAPRLLELAQKEPHAEHRTMALTALIRVAPLPDKRPLAEKLALLKQAMELCTKDSQRSQVLKRASAVRSVDSLRFVLVYVDQPNLSQQACESIVELAHHRELREPNKAEFLAALDKVLKTSKDATVLDRATRYKNNQTWAKPTKQE